MEKLIEELKALNKIIEDTNWTLGAIIEDMKRIKTICGKDHDGGEESCTECEVNKLGL